MLEARGDQPNGQNRSRHGQCCMSVSDLRDSHLVAWQETTAWQAEEISRYRQPTEKRVSSREFSWLM